MSSYKYQTISISITFVIILFSASLSIDTSILPTSCTDTMKLGSDVWSDDFENVSKSLSEWTFSGEGTPNITLTNGKIYSDGPGLNVITHNSTTAIGTWSFDMFLRSGVEGYWTWVYFLMPSWDDWWGEGYTVTVWTSRGQHYFALSYIYPSGSALDELDNALFILDSTWCHIDITRMSDGWMYVFLDGWMILHRQDFRVNTSDWFRMNSDHYAIFDNITVSDTVLVDEEPPYWTEQLNDHVITYGEVFNYTLPAVDKWDLDTWWVNDTENFQINDEGILTSVDLLPIGIYGLEIRVNDTSGNILTGTFELLVLPQSLSTTTTPITTIPRSLDPFFVKVIVIVEVVCFVIIVILYYSHRE